MTILIVALTAIVVSLDSFMAGFSLSLNKKASPVLPAAVSFVTLLLCLATSFLAKALSAASRFADYFGACLLFVLAAMCLFREESHAYALKPVTLGESLTIGVAVGMDAAIANLSLVGVGVEAIAPIVFAATHYLTVALGQALAKKVVLSHTNLVSAIMLCVIALTKLF